MTLQLRRREFLLALGTLLWVSACQSQDSPNQSQASPSRGIVALEWGFVESLLTLGIQPVGVADIKGYQEYVNIPLQLSETVQDVGTRQEPNLETIAQLQPDLILGVNFRHQGILSALESIAPTRLFNAYPDQVSQLTRMKEIFLEVAKLTDQIEAGKTQLQQLETIFQETKEELTQQAVTQRPIVLAEFVPDTSPIRIFTDDALAIQILSAIGLENAWNGKFSQFGFNRIGLEALTQIQDVNFIYVPPDESQQVEQEITTHPIWEQLDFVKKNQVYRLAGDTWLYGGVLSAKLLVQQVRDLPLSS
ncbi:MAG: iron-siderophore ABC transporter substrate-binding protein [Halothece sp. Uz-M2-17]|nr:iron-siderophore ABC transporter substrate-binding protein [Halothece sp. Uz-M2-17]